VIDDEPAVRDLLAQTLRSEGHSATLAASGDEALRIYAKHWRELDLVVLDVMMSGLSGLETFQGLRRIRSDVKVLLCSGFGKQGAIDALLHAGAHALLQKPFDRKQLRAALAEALAQ
jgi:CheY-like chemotaxis protein